MFFPYLLLLLICKPLFLIMLFISDFSPSNVFFGVKIPSGFEKTEPLQRLRKQYQKRYSIAFLLSIITFVFVSLILPEKYGIMLLLLGLPISLIVIMLFCFTFIRKQVLSLKQKEQWEVQDDDDSFYHLGMFYYNKKDKRKMVEKRMGAGWDFNYAHMPGKIGAGVIVLILLIVGYLVISSTQPNTFSIKDNRFIIEGAYEQEIKIDQIENITWLNTIPDIRFKNNGSSLGKSHQGKYKLEGFKKSYLYIENDKEPVFSISLKNEKAVIFINLKTEHDTNKLYIQLNEALIE